MSWKVIVLGTVAHPNIVQLVGVSSDQDHRCLIYELMEGGSLSMKIRDHNRLTASQFTPLFHTKDSDDSSESGTSESGGDSDSEAVSRVGRKLGEQSLEKDPLQGSSNPCVFMWYSRFQVILDACLGLACLHECTLLHCDIKPGNILIRGDGRLDDRRKTSQMIPPHSYLSQHIYDPFLPHSYPILTPFLPPRAAVADFGLSRSFQGAEHKKNKNGYTPGYADPYWRHHGHLQTEGSDVYCIGLVMLQVITGYSAAELHKLMKPPSRVPYPVGHRTRVARVAIVASSLR